MSSARIELAAYALGKRRSIQLSYEDELQEADVFAFRRSWSLCFIACHAISSESLSSQTCIFPYVGGQSASGTVLTGHALLSTSLAS